uniref:CCHC-type domain-containing protein n=1 Tax=Phytophthora ramorum TaxID=164328 RepID=H3GLE8_PHYRM
MSNPNTFVTKIRKFDGSGYRLWARHLQLYLEVKEVWMALQFPTPTADKLKGEELATEKPLHKMVVQHKLAMTIILTALTDDIAAEVADLGHPMLMLNALKNTYRHVCDTTVGALKRDYLSRYLDGGGGMLVHIHDTRLMLADLACYKVNLSDEEKRSNFLQTLGPDWNGYVSTLESSHSLEEMLLKAAAEARRRNVQSQRGQGGNAAAVRTGSAFTTTGRGNGKRKGKCFHCGKQGHYKYECRELMKNAGTNNKSTGRWNSDDQSSSSDTEESGFAFQVETLENADGDLWIIDSGASSHMTGMASALTNLTKLTREVTVTTAGGMRLKATQSGKARLVPDDGIAFTLNDVLYVPGDENEKNYGLSSHRCSRQYSIMARAAGSFEIT